MQRWILHVDMDAFFAAVEQRDEPALRGKPVIVGGLGNRGVVSTASYEARRFGVHSAMAMAEARQRCPGGVFLPCDHAKYSRVSKAILAIFNDFSPLVEPLSLDEAFLDVSGMEGLYDGPEEIARRIKLRIHREIGLTASVGIAPNKFLAKLASDWKKPDGLVLVRPGEERQFLCQVPVDRLWGVGDATAAALFKLGIRAIGQLAERDVTELEGHFGQAAAHKMHQLARGEDDRKVISRHEPQSVGRETTFEEDVSDRETIAAHLLSLAADVGWRLRRMGYTGRTVTVKIRLPSFQTLTRSKTLLTATALDETIYQTAGDLWEKVQIKGGIRLLGVTVSNLQRGKDQLALFADADEKRLAVTAAADRIRDRFGPDSIIRGRLLKLREKEY
ncbi:Hypothetical protein LUCI_0614 [Lucifera butyrica]|uniref:DNA polymerase IV n=1 Tax=Lucifera butyrica TaxID=1351585 RepID=A0A498R2M4_9FIRM|nr:DNA polymerase IV [Lucifera butyrica]VBB05405.1 Hypothetical protein LUCI_0614 [Lucifera butyrica]